MFREREREMFYLTTHSTHFYLRLYGVRHMVKDHSDSETRCRHIGYSFRLTARVLLYAPSHRQDNTYQCLCYTSRGALAGTRNSSMFCVQETVPFGGGSVTNSGQTLLSFTEILPHTITCTWWTYTHVLCGQMYSPSL